MSSTTDARPHPDPDIPAVGIRQPWVELILRGTKTIELRKVNTRQRGRVYLYASKQPAKHPAAVAAAATHDLDIDQLPRGQVVGSVEIYDTRRVRKTDADSACVPHAMLDGQFAWQLRNPIRFDKPLDVRFLPYGIWFYPWKRRTPGRAGG